MAKIKYILFQISSFPHIPNSKQGFTHPFTCIVFNELLWYALTEVHIAHIKNYKFPPKQDKEK